MVAFYTPNRFNDCRFYETYGFERNLPKNVRVTCAINTKILKNNENYVYKNPPGENVLDPIEQLLRFSLYLLKNESYEECKEFLKDYASQIKQLPKLTLT
jgi:hypothetical protein